MNGVIAKLSEMRYRMMTDKPLEPIASQLPDAQIWNSELDALKKVKFHFGKFKNYYFFQNGLQHNVTWYNGPWLFVECYMYLCVNGNIHFFRLAGYFYDIINLHFLN